jgi:type VI secretion system Hcp family effector
MKSKAVSVGLGCVIVLQALTASAALDASVHVQGQIQGTFSGTTSAHEKNTAERVISFSHGSTSPKNINSNAAAGKKNNEPVVVTVAADAKAFQQWTSAQLNNENLVKAVFTFYTAATPTKPAAAVETIELVNVSVQKIETVNVKDSDRDQDKAVVYLKLTLGFQKISLHVDNGQGPTAKDDWEVPGT